MRDNPEYSLEDVCRMLPPLNTLWESVTPPADRINLGDQLWNLRAYGLSPTQNGLHVWLSEEAVSAYPGPHRKGTQRCLETISGREMGWGSGRASGRPPDHRMGIDQRGISHDDDAT